MCVTPSPLLLADSSACLRWLVLRELFNLDEGHPEVVELARLRESDPLVTTLVKRQAPDGSWEPSAIGMKWGTGSRILATAFALIRLGFLGFDGQLDAVQKGAQYLFQNQQPDGSWPLPREGPVVDGHMAVDRAGAYSMIPLQTGFPLRGLAACGFAEDPRCELAYDWLLAQRLRALGRRIDEASPYVDARLPDSVWRAGAAQAQGSGMDCAFGGLLFCR